MENTSIKMWAEDDRPREKLILKGRSVLSNAELIAILIGSGSKEKSALEVAQELLNKFDNSLFKLSKATLTELTAIKGIGPAKAVTILSSMELSRRRTSSAEKTEQVRSSKCSYEQLKPFFIDLQHEEFYILALNQSNKIIGKYLISKGGIAGTIADGKIIFNKLLEVKACGVILAHNHPSGNLKPSQQDIALTKRLKEFGNMIEVQVLDHLIISDNGYYSFADEGLL